jgi:hypothetical protein
MTATMVNLAYMFAAGHGHCGALSDLSTGYLSHAEAVAEDDPYLAPGFYSVGRPAKQYLEQQVIG